MMIRSKKKNLAKNNPAQGKRISRGPGVDCDCPVCVFAKSQAPGDPYDLKDCPKCSAWRVDVQKTA